MYYTATFISVCTSCSPENHNKNKLPVDMKINLEKLFIKRNRSHFSCSLNPLKSKDSFNLPQKMLYHDIGVKIITLFDTVQRLHMFPKLDILSNSRPISNMFCDCKQIFILRILFNSPQFCRFISHF